MLGLSDVGIEWDAAACATRAAAGHLTIRADVATYPTEPFAGKVWGLIASPPCQAFSMAGSGAGRSYLPDLCTAVREERWDARPDPDPKVWLVLEPGRWVQALHPEWVAMEQVPAVLPIWEEYARTLRRWGYYCWSGVLCAADYGVPQTRERAFLLASTVRVQVAQPTHEENPRGADLFGTERARWVSMADALGWPDTWEVEYQRGQGMRERYGERPNRPATKPAPTIRAGNQGSGTSLLVHTGSDE